MKNRISSSIDCVVKALSDYNFEDRHQYAFWLSQAYYFVKHSTPLLALSAGLSVDNNAYHNRCIDHLSEEKGHEKMLLNDLKKLSYRPSDFPELAQTQAFYQTQYYWIQHKKPASFMGYIILLEGLAVISGKELHRRVSAHQGKSFIKVHSDEDVDHLEKALQMMDSFTAEEQELIVRNCELSSQIYLTMLDAMSTRRRVQINDARV